MTGVAGLTLGGGLGWIARKHGPACDNLLSATVVTVDGERVTASAEENPELLWGLRGGGGNFGVVTSFQYRLHPVGPQVIAGGVLHAFSDAPEVFRFFADFVATAPDELSVTASTYRAHRGCRSRPRCTARWSPCSRVRAGWATSTTASVRCGRCAASGDRWPISSRRCHTRRCRAGPTRPIRTDNRTIGSRIFATS